jgi:hypothetical protein
LDGCGLGGPLDALGGQRDVGQFLQEHGGFPEGSRRQLPCGDLGCEWGGLRNLCELSAGPAGVAGRACWVVAC